MGATMPSKEAGMRTRTIGRVVAVWLLPTFLVAFELVGKPLPLLEGYIQGEMRIVGDYPKVGETFEVTYQIDINAAADWTRRRSSLTEDYVAVIRTFPLEAAEMSGKTASSSQASR